MPYDISQFSPGYGGTINSSGNVVNIADTLDEATGQFKPPAMKQFTFQSGATATGDGTFQDVSGYNSLVATLTSTGSAVVQFEYSMDNTTWFSLPGQIIQNTSSNITLNTSLTITSTTYVRFNIVGIKYVRFRISTFTSGVIGVSAVASTGSVQYSSGASLAFGNVDTNAVNNTLLGVGAYNLLFDGTNWVRQRSASAFADGISGGSIASTVLYASNGSTFDRVRVGKVYKYIEFLNLANATGTTVWTPASGKKFRLMHITIQSTVANNIHLRDGAGGTIFSTARFTASDLHLDIDFGNGYLSGLADRVLEVYNATGSTCSVWLTAWGTEE